MSEATKAPVGTGARVARAQGTRPGDRTDVLVIGAGVTGVYQLRLAREAGFSVHLLEAGSAVGTVRHAHSYLLSQNLRAEWERSKRIAGRPEADRYFDYVVDRFDLRCDIRFRTRVNSVVYDERSGTWTARAQDGSTFRTCFLIVATGALAGLEIRGRGGVALEEHWADGPRTYLGVAAAGFPNLFFPGGPDGGLGSDPCYSGDQVDLVMDALVYTRDYGHDVIEVDPVAEKQWTDMVNDTTFSFPRSSRMIAEVVEDDYSTFLFSGASFSGAAHGRGQELRPFTRPSP
ncbi:hypothetical protein ADK57_35355 [Streptomyces sp. MMG1533]|uniref:FAD-dependent oxidoreductase n=1 Tax=Streptomyces sp. MMG1533 TaxID=1415546 RepID=UPI0006B01147|nr:FAD-dependent oxidoreductase [Streptomyces sp. MMG1533]KOU58965.1 hypothetical protein ADK57_35355 [Streptomyces sp. MMG1533]